MGYNFRMQEMCAAIGTEQVRRIDELNERRRKNALYLRNELGKLGCFQFQQVSDPNEHAWYMFAARLD